MIDLHNRHLNNHLIFLRNNLHHNNLIVHRRHYQYCHNNHILYLHIVEIHHMMDENSRYSLHLDQGFMGREVLNLHMRHCVVLGFHQDHLFVHYIFNSMVYMHFPHNQSVHHNHCLYCHGIVLQSCLMGLLIQR